MEQAIKKKNNYIIHYQVVSSKHVQQKGPTKAELSGLIVYSLGVKIDLYQCICEKHQNCQMNFPIILATNNPLCNVLHFSNSVAISNSIILISGD